MGQKLVDRVAQSKQLMAVPPGAANASFPFLKAL